MKHDDVTDLGGTDEAFYPRYKRDWKLAFVLGILVLGMLMVLLNKLGLNLSTVIGG